MVLASLLLNAPARAADHIWSKTGTVFFLIVGNEGIGKVGPFEAYSPDHSERIEVAFTPGKGDGDATPVAAIYAGEKRLALPLDREWAQVEVLWSPDSKSVALTGNFNGYTNSTEIFRLVNGSLKPVALAALQRDMASIYPPCEGESADEKICRNEQNGDQFNYATIAWADATTAVIMGEVPCSSSQGGMMCQVEGYEIDVRSGRILRRMTARELKRRWQSKLAWNLRIPDGPYLKPKTPNAAGSK
jgi:hypothetical protein